MAQIPVYKLLFGKWIREIIPTCIGSVFYPQIILAKVILDYFTNNNDYWDSHIFVK